MLKLNKLTAEDVEYDITRANTHLPAWLERFKDTSRTLEQYKKSVFKISDFYLMLAYGNYALENVSEVKPNLKKAAPYAFLCGFDPELQTRKSDYSIQKELNICLLFGEPELLEQIKALDWSLSEDDIVHPAIYQYDHLLMQIATGSPLTPQAINTAQQDAQKAKNKDVLQFFAPLIEAISALISGDQPLWQASIDKAIKWHSDECKFGDYKDMEEGFICLNALTMAKLGKDMHGWQCHTDSLYLPLFLID
ncbi:MULTISPECIES: Imm49 family immunity protein [unclassified Pseudoalteromonas]|uniref:Imm49 family immunity protein n=2 Tax=Pseudoalteromonas TaxID=53246 RepID=UPI001600E672|nr:MULTISPECIES: Imm49 family immunity protein [unclassified Pseudoalteromonas]MBB1344326.1 immunity 49 family protein [Pseudoalteromonas sp. SR45-6]MBB1471273.1 immunity 49 family protein [Pseudoalteromonas sp. SG41-5]MBB1482158.1 immunity 49 family protein [Pseudoalteromonas sp. SG41-2]